MQRAVSTKTEAKEAVAEEAEDHRGNSSSAVACRLSTYRPYIYRPSTYRLFTYRPDGGAGNRTLVRVSFQNRVYVCRLDFMPSLQSGIEPTSPKPIS